MMRKYRVLKSYTDDLGDFEGFQVEARSMEEARSEALWWFNNARDHDGLRPWAKLPRHIVVERA